MDKPMRMEMPLQNKATGFHLAVSRILRRKAGKSYTGNRKEAGALEKKRLSELQPCVESGCSE